MDSSFQCLLILAISSHEVGIFNAIFLYYLCPEYLISDQMKAEFYAHLIQLIHEFYHNSLHGSCHGLCHFLTLKWCLQLSRLTFLSI